MQTSDIHHFLELESFPKSYAACHLASCPETKCMHRLYGQLLPASVTFNNAILPTALDPANQKDNHCPHYSPIQQIRCYAGFNHLFDEVKTRDVQPLREAIYDKLNGRSNFYRYSNSEEGYLLTQNKADALAAIFARFGYAPPTYEHTFMAYQFHV